MMRRVRPSSLLAGAALALCVLLAGCTGGDDTDPASADASARTTEPEDIASALGAPPSPSTTVSGANETDPVAFGKAFWQAFYGNADRGYDYWWSQLSPLLSPAAAAVHSYDNPGTFTVPTVTGEITEAPQPPETPGVTAEVYVPTDEGRYSLFLSRRSTTDPWRLTKIGFPEGANA